ncbi:unnamed protein product [Closterium sp. NIES-65]|nr:unnamed protein product [Closterium sp. NIES-65]
MAGRRHQGGHRRVRAWLVDGTKGAIDGWSAERLLTHFPSTNPPHPTLCLPPPPPFSHFSPGACRAGVKVAIDGSLAGGFTTLSALTFLSCTLPAHPLSSVSCIPSAFILPTCCQKRTGLVDGSTKVAMDGSSAQWLFTDFTLLLALSSPPPPPVPSPQVRAGLVDGTKVAIDGSSAGGFTTLSALTFRSTFKAGCSLYGSMLVLAQTHLNLHAVYCLLSSAPYNTPEGKQLYKERSPINHVDKLACPLLLLQGLKDQVVSPEQARAMHAAVKAKGLPVAIVEFPDEDHGFRNVSMVKPCGYGEAMWADNIKAALEMEHEFFCRVLLNLPLPSDKKRLTIDNVDEEA